MVSAEQVVAGAAVITGLAAAVQATAAWLIRSLTTQLVETTRAYTAETRRMADEMSRQGQLHLLSESRQAARALLGDFYVAHQSFAPALQRPDEPDSRMALNRWCDTVMAAVVRTSPSVVDEDLRERIDRYYRLVVAASVTFTDPGADRRLLLVRALDAFKAITADLGAYVRAETLGPMRLADGQKAHEWLEAPRGSRVEDFV